MSIIYQSSRCFWKQRCNLDIALVEHPVINVLEVISYDSKLNVEAPRMYVDHFLIKATIHQEELDKRLLELKEPFLRRRQTFDEQQLIKTAMNDAVASLIVGQLTIKEYCAEMRTLLLEFGQSVANFVCECPAGLIPFQIEHRPPVSTNDLTTALGGLVTEMLALHQQREKAHNYQHSARPTLSTQQRWRLPIVCCKVAKGHRLGASDAKLWSTVADRCTVTSASSGAELVEAFAKAHQQQQQLQDSPCETATPHPSQHHHHHQHHHGHQHKRQQSARGKQHSPRPDGTTSPKRVPSSRALTPPRRPSFSTGTAALCSSLERSLSIVADHSIDTTNKYYRCAAALDLEDPILPGEDAQLFTLKMGTTATSRRSSEGGNDSAHRGPDAGGAIAAGAGSGVSAGAGSATAPLSRAPSVLRSDGTSPRHGISRSNTATAGGRSPNQQQQAQPQSVGVSPRRQVASPRHSPRPSTALTASAANLSPRRPNVDQQAQQPLQPLAALQLDTNGNSADLDLAQLGFKQRTPKARPLTAAEKANNDLMLSRMMATVAAVGQSIRSSFSRSRSSAKVHVVANTTTGTTSTSTTAGTPTYGGRARKQQQRADESAASARYGGNGGAGDNSVVEYGTVKNKPQQQQLAADQPRSRVVKFFELFSSQ